MCQSNDKERERGKESRKVTGGGEKDRNKSRKNERAKESYRQLFARPVGDQRRIIGNRQLAPARARVRERVHPPNIRGVVLSTGQPSSSVLRPDLIGLQSDGPSSVTSRRAHARARCALSSAKPRELDQNDDRINWIQDPLGPTRLGRRRRQ